MFFELLNSLFQISAIIVACLIVVMLVASGALTILIKGKKVCLFSGFAGTITKEHQPVKGAKVIRGYEWGSRKKVEETITDENGQFSFESVWATSRNFLEIQFVSHQEIFIEYDGEREQVWGGGKLLEEEFTELGGKPLNLTCNLGDEVYPVNIVHGVVGTNCHWDIDESTRINLKPREQN